jgi:ArsR family transcriptional regulator
MPSRLYAEQTEGGTMSVRTSDRIQADESSDEPATIETDEAATFAELFQALGDPTRLGILSVPGTACVPGEAIVEATGLRQPAVSHHLRVLHGRGLVPPEGRGAYTYCCASSEALGPTIEAASVLLGDRKPR